MIHALAEKIVAVLSGRSSQWPRVRREHLRKIPYCQACGGTEGLEVHHVVPVHFDKTKELEPSNLMTLCEKRGCHFAFGHLYDWRGYNPYAEEDALRQVNKVRYQRLPR